MKKISRKFLDVLFAKYSQPYSYYEQGERCYSHHNKFVRLGYEVQSDGVLLLANTNRLYTNATWFENMLLEHGFQKFHFPTLSELPFFRLKLACEADLFINCVRLLLGDDVQSKLGKDLFPNLFSNKIEFYTDRRFELLDYYFASFGFYHNFQSVMREPNWQRDYYRRKGDKAKDCIKIEGIEMHIHERKPYLFYMNNLHEYYSQQIDFIAQKFKSLFS